MEEYFNTLVKTEAKRLNMSEVEVIDLMRKLLSRVCPKDTPVVPANQTNLIDAINDAESGT